MRTWLLVDMDAIDQATYNRLAADRRGAFLHPPLGAFAVAVDGALLTDEAVGVLVRDGIPRHAIRPAEPEPETVWVELPGPP